MKSRSLVILSVICIIALSVWFSCNPFTTSKSDSSTNYDVLDQSGAARLTITCTINVNGTTWNGGGVTIICSGMGDGSQSESQDPVFNITNGTVTNCTIGVPACDGMHFMGGTCTISNVIVPDIGEDVVSVKKPGTYTVSGCTFKQGADKCFQCNDISTITESSCNVDTMGKFMRQNGGKSWKLVSYCNNCTANNLSECVFRTDSSSTTFYYHSLSTNCGTILYPGNGHLIAN